MVPVAAAVFTLVLCFLAVVQVALACGAPWGHLAWGGAHRVLHRRLRIGSVVALGIYAGMATIVWLRAGDKPPRFVVVACWAVFGYLCLATALNAISRSRPERLVMTPATVVLAAASFIVAYS